jgi:hypothetical protein
MISSTCIWLIFLVYDIFNLYSIISSCILVNSTCVWPKQHAFDPFLQYLIYFCIWPIHQVVDWSKMYLIMIYSACIWSIWSGYHQDMISSSGFSSCLTALLIDQCNQCMGYYAWFCFIQAVFDWFSLHTMIYLIYCSSSLVIIGTWRGQSSESLRLSLILTTWPWHIQSHTLIYSWSELGPVARPGTWLLACLFYLK